MKEELIFEKLQRKLNDNLFLVICTYLFVVIFYGSWAFTDIVTFDAEGFYSLNNGIKWYKQWISIGRWGFVFLKNILGVVEINPFFSISVFLLFFPLSVLLWSYILEKWSGKSSKLALALFIGIYVTHPVWALQFAYRNQLEVATLTMVILPVGVFCFAKWIESKKLLYMLLGYFIITFCTGCYLPFFILFMQAALLYFFFYLEKAISNDMPVLDYWKDVIRAFIFSIIVFVTWIFLAKIIALSAGLGIYKEFYETKFFWGTNPFLDNVRTIWDILLSRMIGNKIYTPIYGIVSLFFVAFNVRQMIHERSYRFTRFLLLLLIEICPVIMHIVSAGEVVNRSSFALVLCIASLTWFDLIHIRDFLAKTKKKYVYFLISLIIAALLLLPQMQKSSRLLWTDVRIMERDILKMNQIYYKALDLGARDGDAICFCGTYWGPNDEANLKYEAIGLSYFEVTITDEINEQKLSDAFQAYGLPFNAASHEQREMVRKKYLADMPCWPESGSIKVVDNLVIVKLGETE